MSVRRLSWFNNFCSKLTRVHEAQKLINDASAIHDLPYKDDFHLYIGGETTKSNQTEDCAFAAAAKQNF